MSHYINLSAQAEKLFRHNRKGSYKTKERYREAYKRFLKFIAEEFCVVNRYDPLGVKKDKEEATRYGISALGNPDEP